MRRWPGRSAALGLVLLLIGIAAPVASGDGLPVLSVDAGLTGVTAPGSGDLRYVTLAQAGKTLVIRVATDGGSVLGYELFRGNFTIPAVAYDGSAAGLSADGRTLVLIRPRVRFPQARTTFALLDASRLRVRTVVRLSGDFSFDAISPDGSLVYLIHYLSPQDPNRYEVRAYEVASARLLREPIVDPSEAEEPMRGSPITRTTSRDGRFAYTLYDGAGAEPFIHALDTSGRTARCIELAVLSARTDLSSLRLVLSEDGRQLTVAAAGGALAVVSTLDFQVSKPAAAVVTAAVSPGREGVTGPLAPPRPVATTPTRASARRDSDLPWSLVLAASLGGIVVISGSLLAARRVLRRYLRGPSSLAEEQA